MYQYIHGKAEENPNVTKAYLLSRASSVFLAAQCLLLSLAIFEVFLRLTLIGVWLLMTDDTF